MSSFRRLENRTGCIRQNATLARRVGVDGGCDEASGAHHSHHRSEQASPDGFSGRYPVSEQDGGGSDVMFRIVPVMRTS